MTKTKMMSFAGGAGLLLLAVLVLQGCQRGSDTGSREVVVFAAASLSDALMEVGKAFEEESGVEIAFNFAGSNVLAQQIAASRQVDLFISADERWMGFLEGEGRIEEGSKSRLLSNRMVVVCGANSDWEVHRLEDLCDLDFKFLCIGDPNAVPAGRYAKNWLEKADCGETTVWENARDRVSPAPDVRAALAQALGREDSIGIVYRTDYLNAKDRARLLLESPSADVWYPIALMSDRPNPSDSAAFYRFVRSDVATEIIERYGFESGDGN